MSHDMNAPHRIRLAGPWERRILDGQETAATPILARVRMPLSVAEDLGPDFRGSVEYCRYFNRPTGIDESTRLNLVLEDVRGMAIMVQLNDNVLLEHAENLSQQVLDIRAVLKSRNKLCIGLTTAAEGGDAGDLLYGLTGEVRLEIG